MDKLLLSFLLLLGSSVIGTSQNVVIAEDFNGGYPSGWTATETDGQTPNSSLPYSFNSPWVLVEDDSPSDSSIVTTSYFENEVPAERWLISPSISLAGFGNYLNFKAKSGDASFTDSLLVMISTTGNDPSDFQDTLEQFNSVDAFWENLEIDLSEKGWNSQSVYLAFKVFSTDGYLLYLDNISVTTEDPVSINELNNSAINIYPNPTTDMVTIQSEPTQKISIVNLQGQVMVEHSNVNSMQVNVSSWTKGIYIVKLENDTSIHTHKIIVQ